MHDTMLLVAAVSYLLAAALLYRELLEESGKGPRWSVALTLLGAACHAVAQSTHWIGPAPSPSFFNVMSLCALVVVALLLLSLLTPRRLFDAGLVALPLTTFMLLIEWSVPAPGNLLGDAGPAIGAHVVSSVMAFGFLSLAGVYAFFVALIDHFLRRHHLNRLVQALPALDVMESLLFSLIKVGFALLTLSLATGLIYVDDLLAQHLAHKTVLSFVAWLLFGVLLWGRRFRGWRGRTAVRLTIAGVILLILSYFGSKWVLEVLLGRHWG